ncbi:MAG TPA: alpha/beta hydrolase, partial [Verrucomicrobiae bacterium]|nr:alpha/beta hydrolase [Verrucomicrobiae bacterium]
LVAHWARRSEPRVKGALLVAPADVDSPAHTPDEVRGFGPIPLVRFPFPSIVVASRDDPFSSLARAELFAQSWGGRFVVLEGAGHINAEAGFGEWPQGRMLLRELTDAS